MEITNNIVLISDPAVLAIRIQECHEPLINLTEQSSLAFGASPEIPHNTDYTKMRQSVYEKLLRAQAKLPSGFRFCIYEAYRSIALQRVLFAERFARLTKKHPDFSPAQLFTECTKMISPVINFDGSLNIPAHTTGGAVDLYLIDENGVAVEMGIHPQDWMQDIDGILSLTHSTVISDTAKQHRHLMAKVLTEVGFANYPTEYWHWSYGDRYWALMTGHTYALYGGI